MDLKIHSSSAGLPKETPLLLQHIPGHFAKSFILVEHEADLTNTEKQIEPDVLLIFILFSGKDFTPQI